jgi:UDP-N-acetylmuramate dehydrogenase
MTYSENLEEAITEIKEVMTGLKLYENEPMNGHCSMKVGGPVRALAVPSDVFGLTKVCYLLKKHFIAPFILGNGTNIVIPDEGLNIFVMSTEKLQKLWLQEDGSIYAEAGVSLSKLSQFAQQHGLTGLEFASGIPGSVGGGLLMNAGAYGGEMKDAVRSVVCYYLPEQGLYECANEQCDFSYRHSFFETVPCVILSAVFELEKGDPEAIAAKMKELNEKRRSSQPLDMPSSGSAFKRPEGGFAAALIEEAGLKGYAVGGAMVSEKHSGFVVNTGSATYEDVLAVMQHIREEVFKNSGIQLDPEIKIYPSGMELADNSQDEEKAAQLRALVERLQAAREAQDETSGGAGDK